MYPDANAQTEAQMYPLYAYKESADPDTLYLHEAMEEKYWPHFRTVIQKEINDRMEDNNFSIIHKSKIPTTTTVLPAIWQLKRKRDK